MLIIVKIPENAVWKKMPMIKLLEDKLKQKFANVPSACKWTI